MQKVIIFLVIIFFSNLVGMYLGMYSYWWFDMTHHFLGGFFVAMLMTYYLADILEPRISGYELRPLKKYLLIAGAVSLVGVIWEFYEYVASQILIKPIYDNLGIRIYFMGDLDDTINDLLMDVLGAIAFIFVRRKRR